MAQPQQFETLVKIGIDSKVIRDSIANADRLTVEINKLRAAQKESGVQNAETTARIKALTQERSRDLRVVQQANTLASETVKGQERLKAELSILTAQYNKLTTEEQRNTEAGRKMGMQIRALSDELKANEKAIGDNRRNVGNYESALEGVNAKLDSFAAGASSLPGPLGAMTTGIVGATKAAIAFIATPLGALLGALALAFAPVVAFLTKTKEGSELLDRAMSMVSATVSVVTDRISMFGRAMNEIRLGNFSKAADIAREAVSGLGEEIEREAKQSRELTRSLQSLTDAERALTVQRAKSRAEVKALNMIAEDTTKTLKEREDAAQQAIDIERGLMDEQVRLAHERFDIIKTQNALGESMAEDLDREAEAEANLARIQMESLEMQTTLQNKLNVIRQQGVSQRAKAAADAKKLTDDEVKAEEERLKAVEQGYIDERELIDRMAETKKSQAIINIANADEQAKAIAAIEQDALMAKVRSIEDETAAYTASADMVGAIDQKKYSKQLADMEKYLARVAEIDRAAKEARFAEDIELLSGRERLEIEAAEFSIKNTEELEREKQRIQLKYAQERIAAMRESAMLDGIISEQEQQNLQLVENQIRRLQELVNTEGTKTLGQMLGLDEEQQHEMMLGLQVVSGMLTSIIQATEAASNNRLDQIDRELQAEISAIDKSSASQADKDKQKAAAEKKAAKDRYKIELAQFKTAKALSIALAVANTATAVMAQLSNPTPYAGFVLAALAAATGAVQIGIAASQQPPPPPQFAAGGLVSGPGSGTSDSIPAMLSNGESVNNAEATRQFGPVLSAINAATGGVDWYKGGGYAKGGLVRKFAAGGVAVSSSAMMRENEQAAMLAAEINTVQPVLVIEEFQDVHGRQVRTEQDLQL